MTDLLWRRMPVIGVVLAAAGFAVMLTPLHLAGALVVVIGAGLAALAAPDYALLAILVLFPLHPLVSRSAALDFGVSGNSLIVFDAWKEVALAAILGGQVARILLGAPTRGRSGCTTSIWSRPRSWFWSRSAWR